VLGFGGLVPELGESLRNVAGHGYIYGVHFVVPIQRETEVTGAAPLLMV
jgi:hypothetical protein